LFLFRGFFLFFKNLPGFDFGWGTSCCWLAALNTKTDLIDLLLNHSTVFNVVTGNIIRIPPLIVSLSSPNKQFNLITGSIISSKHSAVEILHQNQATAIIFARVQKAVSFLKSIINALCQAFRNAT
jgi:hypothetical protein